MNVLFLGTGAGIPAKARNVTSIALQLLEERKSVWLFDCGEGTQHQILHTPIKPRRIEKIFITHMHGDHIYGLPGLLGSRSFQDGKDKLTIYGPKGIKEFVMTTLTLSTTYIKYPLEIIEIEEGVIFEDDTFIVEARKLEHGIPSYGYRITEKDLPGPLLIEKLKEMNVPAGPHFQQLKQGETIILDDGRSLNGADFLGAPQKGRIVTILGDTRKCETSIELAEKADLLIHEATFGKSDDQLAYDYFHSTTEQAAKIAQEADVKKLILTHISSRYQEHHIEGLLTEARSIHPNTELANDFDLFDIVRGE
ncbi:ribonuclease Z [Metabacillus fastidiosus]|uniref:Ribonuclease Z n=1 Tax=Metabacillus fastidiosus TaxID=1458 RepID=A0ABU6NUQ3_9BACI|nr:ribonuclease Z [Metabacillus fastidiosus]MED4400829.1 ribonuclease Z [Metabacillus fastidiosus]MED4463757.1 ribonuclease Z [Metabacillus fastidiosus]